MNISEVKKQIKNTINIYLDKDEYGNYVIPYMKQRPIFMEGVPGVGKTAIMEQIGGEMDLPVVSYSMTHHTRQSAIGLPYIKEKEYGDEKVQTSEYTMSEIVASVYDMMKLTGKKEGILFLDEINCVSETLAPAMLQFLQYKTFGNRQIPEGWVVVTAGNPPEYNKSVRDFDLATRDRLRVLKVDASFEAWRGYALSAGIHPAITSFLEINQDWFYSIQTTVDGMAYVTARGWEDLSKLLLQYEKFGYNIDKHLIEQFISDENIVLKFAAYYELYIKYKSVYNIKDILENGGSQDIIDKASKSGLEERFSVLAMFMDAISEDTSKDVTTYNVLDTIASALRDIKTYSAMEQAARMECFYETCQMELDWMKRAGLLTTQVRREKLELLDKWSKLMEAFKNTEDITKAFANVKKTFKTMVKDHEKKVEADKVKLSHGFEFVERAWTTSHEMVLFVTQLTELKATLSFIEIWGCEEYFKYNELLLIHDSRSNLMSQIKDLNLD